MASDKIKSPRGTAVFPALARPDTKFDENGSYKADLRVDPSDEKVKKFLGRIDAVYKAHMGKAHPKNADSSNKNALYYAESDRETGEPTGYVVVKFRVKNKINKRTGELWDRRPAQFDAKGRPVATPKNVGGGSTIIVSADPYTWVNGATKGVSLQPLAVQIIELKEWDKDRDAADYGFGEEDGFEEQDGGFGDESGDDEIDATGGDDDSADY